MGRQVRLREDRRWWQNKTKHLYGFVIDEDRDWVDFCNFASYAGWSKDFLRQSLCWLEEERLIAYDFSTKKWSIRPRVIIPLKDIV